MTLYISINSKISKITFNRADVAHEAPTLPPVPNKQRRITPNP